MKPSMPLNPSKRFIEIVHHIILFGMLHSTFVAPAQGMIEAFFDKPQTYRGYYEEKADEIIASVGQPDMQPQLVEVLKTGISPIATISAPLSSNKPTSISAMADIKEGVIGRSKEMVFDSPYDNLFKVLMERLPQAGEKVYLKYEVFGVTDHHSVARSINERRSVGGYMVKTQQGWSLQQEELDAKWLKQGINNILFTIPQNADYQYRIRNLSVEIVRTPEANALLVLPERSLFLTKDDKIYIKGFIRGNHPDAKIEVSGELLDVFAGEFEALIPLSEQAKRDGFVVLRALDVSGLLGQEIIFLDNVLEADRSYSIEAKNFAAAKLFKSCSASELIIDGASLTISDTAITEDYELSVTRLRPIDLAPMESGMVNVTKGGRGYRFLPDGTKFEEPVSISIEYDKALLPAGYSTHDIKTFYFDTDQKRWIAVQRDSIDNANNAVISRTNHFTDYINGIIQSPDSPETNAFTPTMMNDIKAADPSSEMTLILPPQASQKGEANISFPIRVPAGRNGLQPNLAVQYNSGGGNGWMGDSWGINIPAITIDTRWGVPHFDVTNESEIYQLNGEQLMYPNEFLPNRHTTMPNGTITTATQSRTTQTTGSGQSLHKKFYPRAQGGFQKIERYGADPTTYYWKVIGTDGTIYWYGGTPQGIAENSVIRDGSSSTPTHNPIVHWGLYRVDDVYGNSMLYIYDNFTVSSGALTSANQNLTGGKIFNPREIQYTKGTSGTAPYKVIFVRETNITRPDIEMSGRLNVKQINPYLLTRIEVTYNSAIVRSYEFNYGTSSETGKLGKKRLKSITEKGISGSNAYAHTFEYYNDITQDGTDIYFDAEVEVEICNDQYIPCPDTDNDGICNANDPCPTIAGPPGGNGCPPQGGAIKCMTVTFPKPKARVYTYISSSLNTYGTSCFGLPSRLTSFTWGAWGNTPSTFNSSTLNMTNYSSGGALNKCPGYNAPFYTGIQYSTFANTSAPAWFTGTVFANTDVTDVMITNLSWVNNPITGNWGSKTYFKLEFTSAMENLSLSNTININNGGAPVNVTISSDPSELTWEETNTSLPVPVLVNNTVMMQPKYNFITELSAFTTNFTQVYGAQGQQVQISETSDEITITIEGVSVTATSIKINGKTYMFTDCHNTRPTGPQPQPSDWMADFVNNSETTVSGGTEEDCVGFANLDFLIQGTMPSFDFAGAVLGSTKSSGYSIAGYGGVGIGWNPLTKGITFGKQKTYGKDGSESFSQMIDITGDGLEDIVLKENNKLFYKKHVVAITYDSEGEIQIGHTFEGKKPIDGINDFYRQESESWSSNGQATIGFMAVGAFVGKDKSNSRSETDIYFTDGNGDGLQDIVKDDRVYFNRIDVEGNPYFEPDSKYTENMVITAATVDLEVPEEYYEDEPVFPKHDIVKVWEAPADGDIKIINNIVLTDTSKEALVSIEMPNDIDPPCEDFTAIIPEPTTSIFKYRYSGGYYHSIIANNCWAHVQRFMSLHYQGDVYNALPYNIFFSHGGQNSLYVFYDLSKLNFIFFCFLCRIFHQVYIGCLSFDYSKNSC